MAAGGPMGGCKTSSIAGCFHRRGNTRHSLDLKSADYPATNLPFGLIGPHCVNPSHDCIIPNPSDPAGGGGTSDDEMTTVAQEAEAAELSHAGTRTR